MRCFILAIDGLEYNYVVENRKLFPNLIQKYYGKVDLSEFGEDLMTPVIWASFITGSREHGIRTRTTWSNPIIRSVRGHLRFLRTKGLGEILLKSGFHMRWVDKRELRKETIFDFAQNSVAISVPAYNLWQEYYDLITRHPISEAVGNEKKTKTYLREAWMLERKKTEIVKEKMQEDWDLFMVHYWIADMAGHLKYNNVRYIISVYTIMDELFRSLFEAGNLQDTLTLIISDHGNEKGMHTPHGFFSSNKPLGLKNPRITDFFDVILKVLKE